MKPNKDHYSWFWHVNRALLSKNKSLGILQFFKSLLIVSSHVNFGWPLPLLILPSCFRIPLYTGASGGLRWTCPNHLSRCWISFSSIGDIPSLSRILSFRTRSILICPQIQRNMRISATLNCWMCRLFVCQHSAHTTLPV